MIERTIFGKSAWVRKICKRIAASYEEYILFFPDVMRYQWSRWTKPPQATVCCYPQRAYPWHTIYRIATANHYQLTDNPETADIVLHFSDTTYHPIDARLRALRKKRFVINDDSCDISKTHTDIVHRQVFGYGLSIDPHTYGKPYVKKSNINSLHNYTIQATPEAPDPAYSYQRIVHNQVDDEVIDIRIPFYGRILPMCTLKYRPVKTRFGDTSTRAEIVKTASVLSEKEISTIETLCASMGVDFGELDVLRDYQTGKIYVVDVNDTPSSPARALQWNDKKRALKIFADTFHRRFVEKEA